jgi:transcription antitermination protein NusB
VKRQARYPDANAAGRRRSLARLAAVQAVYQMELSGMLGSGSSAADSVIREFFAHRFDKDCGPLDADDVDFSKADRGLFSDIVKGVSSRRTELDGMISAALPADWSLERLETVLRALLRAGCYELLVRSDIPPLVVISEYVQIAHAFYSGKEPNMANAILDRLGRVLRSDLPRTNEDTACLG